MTARAGAAQTFRLDRNKPLICSAAELVPFRAVLERNFEQSSPPRGGRICWASAVIRASVSCTTQAPTVTQVMFAGRYKRKKRRREW